MSVENPQTNEQLRQGASGCFLASKTRYTVDGEPQHATMDPPAFARLFGLKYVIPGCRFCIGGNQERCFIHRTPEKTEESTS